MSTAHAQKEAIISLLTLKRVKDGVGHDGAGLTCEFFLNNKKMGTYNDDGWGGDVEILYASQDAQRIFEAFLEEHHVAKLMHEGRWRFLKLEEIVLHTQAVQVVDWAYNHLKHQKSLKRYSRMNIIWGVRGSETFRVLKYTIPLKVFVARFGVEELQKDVEKARTHLKSGEVFLNTNFEELGIKV